MKTTLTPQQARRAWARLYALAGHLLLDGWTPDALADARQLPVLAEALPDVDADHLAARHHAAFGLGVPPYAGVLVGAEGHLGGDRARRAGELLRRAGQTSPRRDVEADHLGVLLRAVGFLVAAEADALDDGHLQGLATLRQLQRELLDAHLLLAWTPLTLALRPLDLPEWQALVDLVGALMVAHRAVLDGEPEGTLPDAPLVDLDDPRTGLKRIARWLTVCGRSGVWLTRADLDALAAAADVPRGFGDRVKMLESLLFAAVDQGRADQVLEALEARIDAWSAGLAELGERGLPVTAWQQRVARTRRVVRTMVEAVNTS